MTREEVARGIKEAVKKRDKEWSDATGLMSREFRVVQPENLREIMEDAKEIFEARGAEKERENCLRIIEELYREIFDDEEGARFFVEDIIERLRGPY